MTKILIYSADREAGDFFPDSRATVVQSPIACLNAATQSDYGLVVVVFSGLLKEQKALVELCGALKKNRLSRHIRILALLYNRHRQLMEALDKAQVDYFKIVGQSGVDLEYLEVAIKKLGKDDQPGRQLERMCRYIYYKPISKRQEMVVCAAYRCRLVLGPARLKQLCETGDYKACPYFFSPILCKTKGLLDSYHR